LEVRTEREVIVLLACETREVVYDEEVDLALVRPAVLQQRLELCPVGRLRALAFFVEPLEDLVAVPAAVLLAARSSVGRLRFSVCSFVLTRT
jgi:hypothetical protein